MPGPLCIPEPAAFSLLTPDSLMHLMRPMCPCLKCAPAVYHEPSALPPSLQKNLTPQSLTTVWPAPAVAGLFFMNMCMPSRPKHPMSLVQNWFMMEQCRIPGDSETIFPLDCQMDQVGRFEPYDVYASFASSGPTTNCQSCLAQTVPLALRATQHQHQAWVPNWRPESRRG